MTLTIEKIAEDGLSKQTWEYGIICDYFKGLIIHFRASKIFERASLRHSFGDGKLSMEPLPQTEVLAELLKKTRFE